MRHFTVPEDGGLITEKLPKDILHGYDRIYTEVSKDPMEGSEAVADEVVSAIKAHEASGETRPFRLGLTTGSSPVVLYEIGTRMVRLGLHGDGIDRRPLHVGPELTHRP